MKRLDFRHVTKPESPSETLKRPFFKLPDAKVLLSLGLALGLSGPMVFPKLVRAQDTATKVVTTNKKQLPPELAKLPTVTLEEMRKLGKQTNSDWFPVPLPPDNPTYVGWVASTDVSYSDGSKGIRVDVEIDTTNFKSDSPKKWAGVIVDGKLINAINLAPLDTLYKKATGNEIKYIKLVADKGTDASGPWISITVVPVDKPNGEICGETPCLNIVYQKEKVGMGKMLIAAL
ncbi:MAG: hypothetical protein PHV13_03155 [Candidatus ainarchaeum sp.]|nr:hypothetical protein [Candidatus ainarchaeum sp.]